MRNPFEVDNAKNLDREGLVNSFLDTPQYWTLCEPKNHVVFGSRGSGKTALARMLSHDHMSYFAHPKARELVTSKTFIGTYIPTNIEWVSGLRSKPWGDNRELAERFFQWRLNLASSVAFVDTAMSCLRKYAENELSLARLERDLARQLSQKWIVEGVPSDSLVNLKKRLRKMEYDAELRIAKERVLGQVPKAESEQGIAFSTPLFTPIKLAVSMLSDLLDIPPSCNWVLCIDETEFLEKWQQCILNSYLRAHTDEPRLVFKLTTMPYCHYTLDTNTKVPLNRGHDFEYLYIDADPMQGIVFAQNLFKKRLQTRPDLSGLTLGSVFGDSVLIDAGRQEAGEELALLQKYGSRETIDRANSLLDNPEKLGNEVLRKMRGSLVLRAAFDGIKGRSTPGVYCGAALIVRCGDGNPRRLLRILTQFFEHKLAGDPKQIAFSPGDQERKLMKFGESSLARLKSEPSIGPRLFDLLQRVGSYMKQRQHGEPLTTDQYTSISVDAKSDRKFLDCIEKAVGLGLLYPNVNNETLDQIPTGEGTYHLAYVLSPYFRLLPRRGRPIALSCIISDQGDFFQ